MSEINPNDSARELERVEKIERAKPLDLEAIKRRVEGALVNDALLKDVSRVLPERVSLLLVTDVPALVAEVERLRAQRDSILQDAIAHAPMRKETYPAGLVAPGMGMSRMFDDGWNLGIAEFLRNIEALKLEPPKS